MVAGVFFVCRNSLFRDIPIAFSLVILSYQVRRNNLKRSKENDLIYGLNGNNHIL